MLDLIIAGGWVMPLIVCCSVVAVSICIERYIALDRQKIAPAHLLATAGTAPDTTTPDAADWH